ncbi:hypothetical protein U1E44_08645 [Arenibacter sp. GZD96]|uniref:hypothetical protein n=1 Tax=Aurantibrevibacter litoralis TaxID=3106030 RepID=UPI002AFFE1E2|nr:hypothetical protein [Arenibacter sp. GZD-96]MEA1786156.1 hypothetical protein [Arenibacter sp. GZD-96]
MKKPTIAPDEAVGESNPKHRIILDRKNRKSYFKVSFRLFPAISRSFFVEKQMENYV